MNARYCVLSLATLVACRTPGPPPAPPVVSDILVPSDSMAVTLVVTDRDAAVVRVGRATLFISSSGRPDSVLRSFTLRDTNVVALPRLPAGHYNVRLQAIGYHSRVVSLLAKPGPHQSTITIELRKDALALEDFYLAPFDPSTVSGRLCPVPATAAPGYDAQFKTFRQLSADSIVPIWGYTTSDTMGRWSQMVGGTGTFLLTVLDGGVLVDSATFATRPKKRHTTIGRCLRWRRFQLPQPSPRLELPGP